MKRRKPRPRIGRGETWCERIGVDMDLISSVRRRRRVRRSSTIRASSRPGFGSR
jgi:hypothetical protein